MRNMYVFEHEHYHNALKSQLHSHVLPRFHRQRGGGIGGVIGSISHYAIPVARKYVLPEVKTAALRTIADVVGGTPVSTALVSNAKTLVTNVGRRIFNPPTQTGSSISRKRKSNTKPKISFTKIPKTKKKTSKRQVVKKKHCKKRCTTKRDIFS